MFLKSTRIVLINVQPSVTSYKYMVTVQRAIHTVFSTVCLSVCSDDNDTKCSKLLRASLRGTSGLTDFSKGSKSHNFVSIESMHNFTWMGSPFTHADVE